MNEQIFASILIFCKKKVTYTGTVKQDYIEEPETKYC